MNALRSLLAAAAMLGFVGVASAAEPLSAKQLDVVTGGYYDTNIVVPNNNNNSQPNNNSQTNFAALVTVSHQR